MRPPALWTTSWDDGHPLDCRVAEMLARHGIAGTFYVPRQAPYGTITSAQLRQLSSGFEIGAHTLRHEQLTDIPSSQSWHEISGSKAWVEDQTGRTCRMFCPPRGRFSGIHIGMAKRAGFLGLRSVELVSLAPPRPSGGIWLMPTSVQARDHTLVGCLRNFAKRGAIGNFWRYLRLGGGSNWPRLAFRMLQQVAETGGVFHLWGHSWELEENGEWQRLDQLLHCMRSLAEPGRILTNGSVCELAAEANQEPNPGSGR